MEFLAVPENAEGVRTEPISCRLDDHKCNCGRQRRIHGVAAAGQDPQARLRRKRVGGGHDVPSKNRRATGWIIRLDEVVHEIYLPVVAERASGYPPICASILLSVRL